MSLKIMPHAAPVPAETLELFRDLAVADICDAMGRNVAFPSAIKPLGRTKLLGTAYTVNLPASENLLLYYAVDNALAGDVLVVSCAAYTERAVCGEIMALHAKLRGLEGFIIDGAVRDKETLAGMDFPVFTRAVTPNGPYKGGEGEINVPVAIGNVVVNPGDIIVGDADGLVAVPADRAVEIAAATRVIRDKGLAKVDELNRTGDLKLPWLYERLEKLGYGK